MKIVTMYIWVPEHHATKEGARTGSGVGERVEALRPEGGRLVTLAPAGSSFSPSTFFVAWEVES